MKHRFFYGTNPSINSYSPKDFSQKDYECSLLFQTKRGAPVMIARHKSLDIWKVQNGFSTVFFGTKAEALAYCKGRFFDADGQAV